MSEEKSLIKYEARDGQEISLSISSIKKYLVHGKPELVSEQEFMYFMAICKSHGMNPYKKDAYLIKFGSDPAAIVTSIDYFRSRARAQSDCQGWKKGVIVKTEDGTIKESSGLVLEGEKIVGGYFEATPKGWIEPFRLEVNLKSFLKKTRDGKITRFWQEDNQPTMIAKVAEAQGLRTLWPSEFQGLYEHGEIKESEVQMVKSENGKYEASDEKPEDLYKANAEVEEKPNGVQQEGFMDSPETIKNGTEQGEDTQNGEIAPPGIVSEAVDQEYHLCMEMINSEIEMDEVLVDMARINAGLKNLNPETLEDAKALKAAIIDIKEKGSFKTGN